jgi:hypothetical protein
MIRRKALGNCLSQIVGAALAIGLGVPPLGSGRAEAESLISLTTTGNLVTFDSSTPGTTDSSGAISGLLAGEVLLGIDRRPATGLLYGLGSTGRIDTIKTTTGVATAVGATQFTPAVTPIAFGFYFNPVPDRIRVVGTDTSNFRLNPKNGAMAGTDAPLRYAAGDSGAGPPPRVSGRPKRTTSPARPLRRS